MNKKTGSVAVQNHILTSELLDREVKVDFYVPSFDVSPDSLSLLLVNDGQDLVTMKFENILGELYDEKQVSPL